MKKENTYTSFWKKFTLRSYRFELTAFLPILTAIYLFRSYWINVNETIWISILYTTIFIVIVSVFANLLAHFKQKL